MENGKWKMGNLTASERPVSVWAGNVNKETRNQEISE
jgi:hypothetical protein